MLDHAIADKAVADTGNYGDLLDFPGDAHDRGHDILASLRAADDFQQLHDIRRTEEMQADDILRATGKSGNPVSGRGSMYSTPGWHRLGDFVEFLKTCSLTPISSNTASIIRSAVARSA